jgi:hypothetical protein
MLNRGRMVEWIYEKDAEGRVRGRQRLGLPLDGGKGRVTANAGRCGLYLTPGGIGFQGQGVEIKDREPRRDDDRKPRVWSA